METVTVPIAPGINSSNVPNSAYANAHLAKYLSVADVIATGVRVKFRVILLSDVTSWAVENSKLSDSCRDIKAALDANVEPSETSVARALKLWLLTEKAEGIQIKQAKDESSAQDTISLTAPPVDSNDRKTPVKERAKTPSAKPSKGTGKTSDEKDAMPSTPNNAVDRKKMKLRDRGPGRADAKVTIDDEPADGPDVYYLLKDFEKIGLLKCLIEELSVPISAIIQIHFPELLDGVKGSEKGTLVRSPNDFLAAVRQACASSDEAPSLWRQLVFQNLHISDLKDSREAFDCIAKQLFYVLSVRKHYMDDFRDDPILGVSSLDSSACSNMNFYRNLVELLPKWSLLNYEVVTGLALESVCSSLESETELVSKYDLLKDLAILNKYFETSTSALACNDDKSQGTSPKLLLHQADRAASHVNLMEPLKHFGLQPTDTLRSVRGLCAPFTLSRLLEALPKIEMATILNRRLAQKNALISSLHLEKLSFEQSLLRFELVNFFESVRCPRISTLVKSAWFENLDSVVLPQSIQRHVLTHPSIQIAYSPWVGFIMGLFPHSNSPPDGMAREVKIKSKVGFGTYFKHFDNEEIRQIFVKSSSQSKPLSTSYLAGDHVLYLKSSDHLQYFEEQSALLRRYRSETTIPLMANHNTNNLIWSDASISWCFEESTRNEYAVVVEPGVVAAFYKPAASSMPVCQVSFVDGSCVEVYGDKTVRVTNATLLQERSKVVLPTGQVIKHLENGCTEVLFPDGNHAHLNSQREWTCSDSESSMHSSVDNKILSVTPLRSSVNSDIGQGIEKISRENHVTLIKEKTRFSVSHSDGTTILTELNGQVIVTLADSIKISFNTTYSLEFEHLKCHTKLSCEGSTIRLASSGVNVHSNIVDSFVVTSENDQPILSARWSSNDESHIGFTPCDSNDLTPKLFVVKEDGSGFQIMSDEDFKHLSSSSATIGNEFSSQWFVDSNVEDNIQTHTYIRKSARHPTVYRSVTHYPELTDGAYNSFLRALQNHLQNGTAKIRKPYLSSLHGDPLLVEDVSPEYIFGKSSLETQARITEVLLQSFDNLLPPHDHNDNDVPRINDTLSSRKLLGDAGVTLDVKPIQVTQTLAHPKSSIEVRIPKYFESDEALKFARTIETQVTPKTPDIDPGISEPASKTDIQRAREPAFNTQKDSKRSHIPSSSVRERESQILGGASVPAQLPSVLPEGRNVVSSSHSKISAPSTQSKSHADFSCNDAPAEVPNQGRGKFAFEAFKQPSIGSFDVFPKQMEFICESPDETVKLTLRLRNCGIDNSRFKANLDARTRFRIEYKPGLIAPGMSVPIAVYFTSKFPGEIVQERLHIVTECEILHIPLRGITN